jgi:hypothetical protein
MCCWRAFYLNLLPWVTRATAPDLGPQGAKEYVEVVAVEAPIPEHVRSRLPVPAVGFALCRALAGMTTQGSVLP